MEMHRQKITSPKCAPPPYAEYWSICSNEHCSHHIAISASQWGDDVRLSDLEPASAGAPRSG